MPEQDIAAEWKSFDDAKRSRLLQKMSADQKRSLRRAIEGAGTHSLSDFTTNDKGEGLYRMLPASQQGYTDTAKEIKVRFSKVESAQGAGYHLHPDEVPGYRKDFKFRGQGPTWLEKVDQAIQKGLTPTLPSGPVTSVWDAGDKVEQGTRNIVKAAGRTVYGSKDYAKQLASAYADSVRTGQPTRELVDLLDPAQIPAGLWRQYQQDRKTSTSLAVENLIGTLAGIVVTGEVMGRAGGKVIEAPGKAVRGVSQAFREKYGPSTVEVAGETVPVGVGEAYPVSSAGRYQISLKRRGVSAERFEKLEREQQVKVKAAIKRVAQQTSEVIPQRGPRSVQLPEEPGVRMEDAAEATFSKARPMYTALDNALRTMPASFESMSPIVKRAIVRARKLGVQIDSAVDEPLSVVMDGKKITQAEYPNLWQQLVDQNIINETTGQGTPLSALQKVRSQLLKMRRMSADAAQRYAIGSEVDSLNKSIEGALKGGSLYDDWKEADRLWRKAYALREVADAIKKSTKGTPIAEQAPGLGAIPPKLQAESLVRRLNTLAEDGTLEKAFTPEQARNLRQAADVLDRIQRTHVGTESGESLSHSRSAGQALSGARLPLYGAGVGAVTGLVTGGMRGAAEGAFAGAALGHILQRFGEPVLVRIMTRTDGAAALKALEAAKTPAARLSALKTLNQLAAAQSATRQQSQTLTELRAEAKKRKPAGSPRTPNHYDVQTGTTAPP
jgi:hypothetical protein